jgi:hypothetical protein
MTTNSQLVTSDALPAGQASTTLPGWIGSIGRRTMAWVDGCADRFAAAAIYQQLSALSDGELARRGLSRATLAHDLHAARVRNPEQSG